MGKAIVLDYGLQMTGLSGWLASRQARRAYNDGSPPGDREMPAVSMLGSRPKVIVTETLDSPVGPLMAGATDDGVCMLEFAGLRSEAQVDAIARQFQAEIAAGEHPLLEQLRAELDEYFAGRRRGFT